MARPTGVTSPLWMAILNVTPDSFSDGGQLLTSDRLIAHAEAQVAAGATVLDVGGESTRPGASPVSLGEELDRVIPAIQQLRAHFGPSVDISIDTYKAPVAVAALAAGASWVNDVTGMRHPEHGPALAQAVAQAKARLVIMHSVGEPGGFHQPPNYPQEDVVSAVYEGLARQTDLAIASGVAADKIWVDVGFGFGKTVAQNVTLLNHLHRFHGLGFPVLAGVSRKSFLAMGEAQALSPLEREAATAIAHAKAWDQGVQGFRVHDTVQQVAALALYRHCQGV
jgi:dihydropteroate synthase